MRRIFFTILCACMAVCGMAQALHLNRTQVRHPEALNYQDTQCQTGSTPSVRSAEEFAGFRIASMDAYDFVWDGDNAVAVVDQSHFNPLGSLCRIRHDSIADKWFVKDLFGSFEMSIDVDLTAGIVKIKTGEALATFKNTGDFRAAFTSFRPTAWTLYAVSLSWLTGDDDNYDDIVGHIQADGTVVFDGEFAFLVNEVKENENHEYESSWGLSSIFKNFTLLCPNGYHEFIMKKWSLDEDPDQGMGNGGVVPRPVRPGNTKPVTPRPIHKVVDGIDIGQQAGCNSAPRVDDEHHSLNHSIISNQVERHYKTPVYIGQTDDTTLMVCNLFGMGYRCHMYLCPNGEIRFPGQQISETLFTHETMCYWSQGSITWGKFYFYSENGTKYFYLSSRDNRLYWNDGVPTIPQPQPPEFCDPVVNDLDVEFSAVSTESDTDVFLYVYNEETNTYNEKNNPWVAPRSDAPYTVHLIAIAYNVNTGMYSDEAYMEYEVPALDGNVTAGWGDVNGDGVVSISDVTALIDYLLSTDQQGTIADGNADVNQDGTVSISDVTTLIDRLLSR